MILSVSRRTDIPAFYFDWFLNRLKEGFLYVRNPFNARQVSKIILNGAIDGIVFWTKNPASALGKLEMLKEHYFYFQYTLNPYDSEIERNLPPLDERIETFIRLSRTIGKDRVVWRYDPIFLTEKLDVTYHIESFAALAEKLGNYTDTVMISILDEYKKIKKNMEAVSYRPMSEDELSRIMSAYKKCARQHGLKIYSCAEGAWLQRFGIEPGRCIDNRRLGKLMGRDLPIKKDKNQREVCGCVESIDVGGYNTCPHGCIYCYANFSPKMVRENNRRHDVMSPLLIGNVEDQDKIAEKEVKRYAALDPGKCQ